MKKLITLLLLVQPLLIHASAIDIKLQKAKIDISDLAAIKRGAEHYMSNCLGCHSAKLIRYSRIAEDLGLDKDQILAMAPENTGYYDPMLSAMNPDHAKQWFNGALAPDLSLIGRSRGADWLYTYLNSFYVDDSKPLGTNNQLVQGVSMPNVLFNLQGRQELTHKTIGKTKIYTGLQVTTAGSLDKAEFAQFTTDLVSFLDYIGEPSKLKRLTMGKYVLLFILLFIVIAYLLKKEYWQDIH